MSQNFTRLFLIRHGQTDDNTAKIVSGLNKTPINEVGREQAQKMALRVKNDYRIDALYSSPLLRTTQTTEILSKEIDVPFTSHQALIEYDFGVMTQQKFESFKQSDQDLYQKIESWNEADFSTKHTRPIIPGAESIQNFRQRIDVFRDHVLNNHQGEHVAAVSHGGFIKFFLHHMIGGDLSQYIPFWVDNTSISIIDFYKGNPIVRLFNDNHHLKEELVYGRPRVL